MTDSKKNYGVSLTSDEAIVLFEFLSRVVESDELTIESDAEMTALQNILCSLESDMTEPFESNYKDLLESARKNLQI